MFNLHISSIQLCIQYFIPARIHHEPFPHIAETYLFISLVLFETLRYTKPLRDRQSDGAAEVLEMLDAYGLSKDDFSESLKDLQFTMDKDPVLKDRFEAIDSKTKAALTRLYNATEHRSQVGVCECMHDRCARIENFKTK